ncbi:MAG: hypothetical protein H6810_03720 [Phycisphaeraceae bacterium]|nr:MAG: hypothetical protein H6810_03720 [Phycisphaeraceae bacterium]
MSSTRIIGAAALSLCAGLSVSTANAEIFQRVQGDDSREHVYSINRTLDGGYVTTGYRDYGDAAGAPAEDVLITKHKSDGSVDWQRLWKGPGRDIGYSVQQTFDGGYIVAAESTSSPVPGMDLLLIRLDPAGGLVWNRYYTGGFMSDPIHTPHPGVALDQGFDGEIYVTGNVAGVPLVLAVGPGGGMMWTALYTDPAGPDGFFKYAFTDIKFDRIDGTLVVSGTSTHPDFNQPGGIVLQDAFMMRTNPVGAPIWSWNYDFPFDLDPDNGDNNRETGDGLDVGPNGDLILNGRTDFGTDTARRGTHLISTDRAGIPMWSAEYSYFSPDGVDGRPATAYAAVRWDSHLNVVQTGRVPDSAGTLHAWESLTGFGGVPLWFWEYGGDEFSRGESVIPTPDPCGYAMAGQFEFIPPAGPFARGETYLVKNNDLGETGCLERRWDFQPQFQARLGDAPIQPQYRDELIQAENFLTAADTNDRILCYDPDCTPGAPCPCDMNGDGILDLTDVTAFIGCFTGGLPCGDLNGDGILDLSDISAFISCFLGGCP